MCNLFILCSAKNFALVQAKCPKYFYEHDRLLSGCFENTDIGKQCFPRLNSDRTRYDRTTCFMCMMRTLARRGHYINVNQGFQLSIFLIIFEFSAACVGHPSVGEGECVLLG